MDKYISQPIYNSVIDIVGRTPLLRLNKYVECHALGATIIAKVERGNPGGSVKDRVALAMIEDAEEKGVLKAGGTIIEPTSGNTGVGLALVGAAKGYRVILTMPETMTLERRKLAAAYGAEIVLTAGKDGMKGAIREAEKLRDSTAGAVILQQFDNPSNPRVHYLTTGQEIIADAINAGITIDAFVAGVGTGGTISGVGKAIKEKFPLSRVVAVEPKSSAVLSGQPSGSHRLQGIGAGFVPKNYDPTVVDEILCIADEDAFSAARSLAKVEGLLVGISSGAALTGATVIAKREDMKGKNVVVLLPDTGERYLSTDLFG